MKQILITKDIRRKLEANYKAQQEGKNDLWPVVKLFHPYGSGTWLIQDIDENGRMFGLCDLGMGFPELGDVDLAELEEMRARIGGRAMPFQAASWRVVML